MKICTAEIPDEAEHYATAIEALTAHTDQTQPDLLVLPEMPFTPWIFHVEKADQAQWEATVKAHATWLTHLCEALPTPIIASRPISVGGKNLNQAVHIDAARTIHPLRSKHYLPNDFPAIERVWFSEGDTSTGVFEIEGARIGIQLCSEIMYPETPRQLAAEGAQVILQCRATGPHPRWRAASLLAAATSGTYVIGANRRSTARDWFSGTCWAYSPQGNLLAETSAESPFTTVEIDLDETAKAQAEYPVTMFDHYRK